MMFTKKQGNFYINEWSEIHIFYRHFVYRVYKLEKRYESRMELVNVETHAEHKTKPYGCTDVCNFQNLEKGCLTLTDVHKSLLKAFYNEQKVL